MLRTGVQPPRVWAATIWHIPKEQWLVIPQKPSAATSSSTMGRDFRARSLPTLEFLLEILIPEISVTLT